MYFMNIIFLSSWGFFIILKDYLVDIQMSASKREHSFCLNYLINCIYLMDLEGMVFWRFLLIIINL